MELSDGRPPLEEAEGGGEAFGYESGFFCRFSPATATVEGEAMSPQVE